MSNNTAGRTADQVPDQVVPPTFSWTGSPLHALDADIGADGGVVVALPVLPADGGDEDGTSGPALGPGAADLGDALGIDLLAALDHHGATGKPGEVHRHPVLGHEGVREVALVGVGDLGTDAFRLAGAALARSVRDREAVATTLPGLADDAALRGFVVGLTLASFGFHVRSNGPRSRPVGRVLLAGDGSRQPVVDKAVAVAGAGWRARFLATVPSNIKNPAWLADQAVAAAGETGLKVTVWDEKQLAKEGFGGILAVGSASATPPRLVRLDHTPTRSGRKTHGHVVLVGKGITFDTGGLSIKPGEAMVNMKRDMTGGAVVIATMAALAALDVPVRVTGLVAAAENAIGGASFRPGDVITHYGGRTTEVTNTDAEGRLVMADALAYAVDRIKPDALVDVATLTGAMKVALGLRTGGYFADHEGLAAAIAAASAASGERLWRMPLHEEYGELIESKVADADNAGGGPGAITAALFLQPFTGDVPWAHLDIASVGDAVSDWAEWTAGPTGFGTRVLLHWLEDDPLGGL
ncbi:leucyl aminopeptidase family protein [Nocardioides guangzhouensis]|uniref:Probable cytosol aminopeptidase n=1 Tax=Nocardioides guangzhouensis TaxID=2497878 RepID=A0A4Q4ZJI3_9ACTN|nr:leucyl aminopeptidase family protein [Nocardioides guangzhouensis]